MKKIAIIIAAAAIAVSASAQNNEKVANLVKKAEVYFASEGKPARLATPTALVSQKTYFYDRQTLEVKAPYIEKLDTMVIVWQEAIRRNATSGWAIGVQAGAIQMAENFSPTAGIEATFAGKRIILGAGIEAAISKHNDESSRAGETFVAPIFSAKAGIVASRFSLFGYDNMGYVAFGYEFKYILDKNENQAANINTTTENYFYVEGNSMCHTGFAEARFSLKHLKGTSLGVKVYGGVYNRYYQEGSRRKAMFGGSISLYFNGAKKNIDNDVVYLENELKSGDYTAINAVINQMRATK